MEAQPHGPRGEIDGYRLPTIDEIESNTGEFDWQHWMQPERIVASFDSGIASEDHVDSAGHGTQMNAFPSAAALGVVQIAVKRELEQRPGPLSIPSRQNPTVSEATESRAVARAGQVEIDRARDHVRQQWVTEPIKVKSLVVV
jgi:hypothetical protein